LTWRPASDVTSLRFRSLSGTLLYSRTDLNNDTTFGYDSSGQLLVTQTALPLREPDQDAPWWARYQVANLYQDFLMDSGTTGIGSFGDDYIAGGAGNDMIFGGLGHDDLIGGSSDFFSLTTPDQRPDGSDLIFGGAGTRISRDNDTSPTADTHARDADTIVGDNGRIVRIVGVNGGDVAAAVGSTAKFLSFQYDLGVQKVIVRGVTLLDYTVGGPDFRPDL